MRLSVVIPAFNEKLSIQRCLESLCCQKTCYPYEIIVVDNNSTDGTAAIAEQYPHVRVLSETRQGVALARQAGEDAATGEVVAHTDADSELPENWLESIGRAFEGTPGLVLSSGPMCFPSGPLLARIIQTGLNWAVLAWWLLTRRLAVVNGCNFAVRRTALAQAGGFPVDLPETGDSRILSSLRRRGKVIYCWRSMVSTSARRFLNQGVLRVYADYLVEQLASVFKFSPERIMSRPVVRLPEPFMDRHSRSRRLLLIVPILPAVAVAAGCTYLAINPGTQVYGRVVLHGPRTDRVVALTFDDGPNEPYTSEVLDILDRYGIKATFFEVAENVEFFPESTERIAADGHVLGNHSFDHSRLASAVDFHYREVDQAQAVFEAVVGVAPALFRPPAGIHTPWLMRRVDGQRMVVVNWDTEGLDWQKDATAESIADRVLSGTKPGSIVLLHDGDELRHGSDRSQTVEALPRIIEGLQSQGYRFVTVPQMLKVPAYQMPEAPP